MTRRRACIALWPVFLLITGPVFAAPTPGYWQGIYRAGNEVNSLQPCPGMGWRQCACGSGIAGVCAKT